MAGPALTHDEALAAVRARGIRRGDYLEAVLWTLVTLLWVVVAIRQDGHRDLPMTLLTWAVALVSLANVALRLRDVRRARVLLETTDRLVALTVDGGTGRRPQVSDPEGGVWRLQHRGVAIPDGVQVWSTPLTSGRPYALVHPGPEVELLTRPPQGISGRGSVASSA